MAEYKKISQLPEEETPTGADWFEMEDANTGVSSKVRRTNLVGATVTGGGSIDTQGEAVTFPDSGVVALKTGAPTPDNLVAWNNAHTIEDSGIAKGGVALKTGTPTAGRIAEWADANAVKESTLTKTGAGVLTLAAAVNATLTVPATGTAALKTGTPAAGRVASWTDANTLQDAGFAATAVARKTGTPAASRMAEWADANTVQDAGFAASDVARLSQAQTFTGVKTFIEAILANGGLGCNGNALVAVGAAWLGLTLNQYLMAASEVVDLGISNALVWVFSSSAGRGSLMRITVQESVIISGTNSFSLTQGTGSSINVYRSGSPATIKVENGYGATRQVSVFFVGR